MINGFKQFTMRGNVVDLAVAVVIGVAFGKVVTSLVDNVINPIIAAIFGKSDMSNVFVWTLNDAGTPDPTDDAVLSFGAFLTTILSFVIIALAIYFLVVVPLNAIAARRKSKEEPVVEDGPTEIELLVEIRDALNKQN